MQSINVRRCQPTAFKSQSGHVKAAGIGRRDKRHVAVQASAVKPPSTIFVAGATGGVGQLTAAKLLERGFTVKALARNKDRAAQLFSNHPNLQVVEGDTRVASKLASHLQGVDAVCCCTGTTAFPSSRWEGNNGPRPTDYVGTTNLIKATPAAVKRFVLVTSAGVERQKEMPWLILNLFGVLKYKRDAEQALEQSGLPYTILRPSRLTDGPYTSFDLNTLLQATAGSRQDVVLCATDSLLGEASRIAVAEAVVQALAIPSTANKAYALSSSEGNGPGSDQQKWMALFDNCA